MHMQRKQIRQEKNPAKKMARNMSVFAFITCLIVIGIIFVFYQHKNGKKTDNGGGSVPEVQRLAEKDLELGYPGTPSEVLKLLGRINQCIYNSEGLGDEYLDKLLKQMRMLYSTSLLEQNSFEEHKKNLLAETEEFNSKKRKIVNYTVDKSSETEYKTIDGKSCAYLQMAFFMNEKGNYSKSYQDYVLVNEDNKWKIFAFKKNEQEGQENPEGDS